MAPGNDETTLYELLVGAEKEIQLGAPRGSVNSTGALAEAVFKEVRKSLPNEVIEAGRPATLKTKGAGYKPAFLDLLLWLKGCEKTPGALVTDDEFTTLADFAPLRNLAAHADPKPLPDDAGERANALLHGPIKTLACRHQLLPIEDFHQARVEGSGRSIERHLQEPIEHQKAVEKLDRREQKGRIGEILLDASRPLLVVFVEGKRKQGHAWLAWLLRTEFRRRFKQAQWMWHPDRGNDADIVWPQVSGTENRLGTLIDTLRKDLTTIASKGRVRASPTARDRGHTAPTDSLEQRLTDLRDALVKQVNGLHGGLMLRHRISEARADDAALMKRYIEQVWLPLSSRLGQRVSIVLFFEIHVAESSWRTLPGWLQRFLDDQYRKQPRTTDPSSPKRPWWSPGQWWRGYLDALYREQLRTPCRTDDKRLLWREIPELGPVPPTQLIEFLREQGCEDLAGKAEAFCSERYDDLLQAVVDAIRASGREIQ